MEKAPKPYEETLHHLFQLIELEFERIYDENKELRHRLVEHNIPLPPPPASKLLLRDKGKISSKLKHQKDKLFSAWKDMKVDSLEWIVHKGLTGHKDGVLDVNTSSASWSDSLLGTASADKTARIWSGDSLAPLYVLVGHGGCVNALRFHPLRPIVCTACGDGATRLWKIPVGQEIVSDDRSGEKSKLWTPVLPSKSGGGGKDDLSAITDEERMDGDIVDIEAPVSTEQESGADEQVISNAVTLSNTNEDIVGVSEFVNRGNYVVAGTWRGDAYIWDVDTAAESSTPLHVLNAHDDIITEISSHPVDPLFLTSSVDHFVAVWDLRSKSQDEGGLGCTRMNARQEAVRSALFDNTGDFIVTGGDDGNVKIWDRRNLRSSLTQIHCNSGVNRMSISPMRNLLAVPLDGKQVRIYDMMGNKLGRLKSATEGHKRMICSCSWDLHENHIFTVSFDTRVLMWKPIYLQAGVSPATYDAAAHTATSLVE